MMAATPPPPLSHLGEAAVKYSSELGLAVFQLKGKSKEPLPGSHGYKDATTDSAKHINDWTVRPEGNIGLATGEINGLLTLDIDPRSKGDESLARLEELYGKLPPTVTAITGRGDGGKHLFFRYPKDLPFKLPKSLAEGIDIKGNGGYVLIDPSIHPDSGLPYQFVQGLALGEFELAELPGWVIEAMRQTRQGMDPRGENDSPPPPPVSSAPLPRTHGGAHSFLWVAFEAAGWLRPGHEHSEGSEGQRYVVCPWRLDHSPGPDSASSAVIFPPKAGHTLGKFHCSHTHCDGVRTPKDVLRILPKDAKDHAEKLFPPPPSPTRMTPKGPLTLVGPDEEVHDEDPPKPPAFPWVDSIIDSFDSDPFRLKTGIEPIDQGWRGGARMGGLWVIGGAPGAGKTTLVTQLAHDWAAQGIPVFMIASDEERDGLVIRLGQQIGLDRGNLERWLPDEKKKLKQHLAKLPLKIIDPQIEKDVSVPTVAKDLRITCPEGPGVLILDSLQTLAAFIPDDVAEGMKAKVDWILKQCKAAAKQEKIFIVVLSELTRAAYKFKGDGQVEDIAAAKESGAIEYTATAITILRSVPSDEQEDADADSLPDNQGLVVCTMPKSRLGRVAKFALRQCFQTARFTLDQLPVAREPAARGKRKQSVEQTLFDCLLAFTETGLEPDELKKRVRVKNERFYAATRTLEAQGRLVTRKGPDGRKRCFPVFASGWMEADADEEGD